MVHSGCINLMKEQEDGKNEINVVVFGGTTSTNQMSTDISTLKIDLESNTFKAT